MHPLQLFSVCRWYLVGPNATVSKQNIPQTN